MPCCVGAFALYMSPSRSPARFLASAFLAVAASLSTSALGQSPNTPGFLRDGANHHRGDDAFETAFGRAPGLGDETLRTHVHLEDVRTALGFRASTTPALEERRAELLAYLDEYIAVGTTPKNEHLPWRTPVFIDDDGRVCAVGYLIERSAGRALAERIAHEQRYEYHEEIAADMPEVADWIAGSGFTLDELASIQPGYIEPAVEDWRPWNLGDGHVADGAYEVTANGLSTRGTIRRSRMNGDWTRKNADDVVIGDGTFDHGSGTWRSFYTSGAMMASGRYANDEPAGAWTFYFESGNVAARGGFTLGRRAGSWTFFYDDPTPKPIAAGRVSGGRLGGPGKHFEEDGHLLATSNDATPATWKESFGGYILDITPGEDGVVHVVHQGDIGGDTHRLDEIVSADGKERLYVLAQTDSIFDAQGNSLEHSDNRWTSSACDWSTPERRAALRGDVAALHGYLFPVDKGWNCSDAHDIPAARGAKIDALLTSVRAVRSVSPDFVRKLALGDLSIEDAMPAPTDPVPTIAQDRDPHDLAKVLAANMSWYVEWPHVDGRFVQVFSTLPGYAEVNPSDFPDR